ncbi:MAG TPA: TlpA disulfide reductase family protein [Solirubrobacterales bacterium]
MSARALLSLLAVLAVIGLLGFGLLSKGKADLVVGDPVPDKTLPYLEGGGEGSIADYRGRWVLVNLWASWCDPCRAEAPELEAFANSHPKMTVLGINVQDNSDDALAFVRDHHLTFPQLRSVGDERTEAFGSTGVPENFLVDPSGHLALIWRGVVDREFLDEQVAPRVGERR